MPKILFADNDPEMARTMARYLAWQGFSVESIDNPAELLDRLLGDSYDLLIYDIFMHGVDSYDFLRKIREHSDPGLKKMHILVSTPEHPDREEIVLGQRLRLYFINKFRHSGEWATRIKLILGKELR
ncbi:MAG: response regulator [Candidatus Omnitrophica bacterium]|nr:response regulator [Candidatus Omnitrophota bacterium]